MYNSNKGCEMKGGNDNGGKPLTALKETTKYYEAYESHCADGSLLEFRCELGGCGL